MYSPMECFGFVVWIGWQRNRYTFVCCRLNGCGEFGGRRKIRKKSVGAYLPIGVGSEAGHETTYLGKHLQSGMGGLYFRMGQELRASRDYIITQNSL